jgi:hypothetical protein
MKWVSSLLAGTYAKLDTPLSFINIGDPNNITISNLRVFGDNNFFLNNVQQFLIVTVVLSIVIFVAHL